MDLDSLIIQLAWTCRGVENGQVVSKQDKQGCGPCLISATTPCKATEMETCGTGPEQTDSPRELARSRETQRPAEWGRGFPMGPAGQPDLTPLAKSTLGTFKTKTYEQRFSKIPLEVISTALGTDKPATEITNHGGNGCPV